ncbi:MFS transporter [Oceanimonas sp. NS1]|nr:MFS transporter [Oceanimonas sp. NS1]
MDKSILAPFAAIYGVGLAPLLILPFIFTSVISEFGVGESAAGSLITYYIATMCIASLAVAPIIGRAPRRTLALVATLIAIIGSVAVMFVDSYAQGVAAFVFAGIGSGIALSCGNAVVAGYKNPDDSIHKIVLIGTILMVVLLNLVPSAIGHWSLAGAMGVLALVHLLLLPLYSDAAPASRACGTAGKRRSVCHLCTAQAGVPGHSRHGRFLLYS